MAEENKNEQANQEGNAENGAGLETKVKELEQLVANKENEIAALKNTAADLQANLSTSRQELEATINGYKTLLTQQHPDITAEMISGASINALNESLEKARNLMAKMKQTVLKELAQSKIPMGAPGRQSADMTVLSPREKISYGVGGKH